MSLRVSEQLDFEAGTIGFVGRANIWVDESLNDNSSSMLVQHLIATALLNTDPGQLEVITYDDTLSGLAAPFQDINNGGEKLLQVINEPSELLGCLNYLRYHVQGVANVIQGRASTLTEFRRTVGYPIESYKLVVLSTDFDLLGEDIQNAVRTLAKAGPRNGVSFIIHSTSFGVNEFFLDMFQRISVSGYKLLDKYGNAFGSFMGTNAEELIGTAQKVRDELISTAVPVVPFAEIEPLDGEWLHSSRDGITFTVGRYGMSPIAITLGDEVNQRHNALVTGAVGQGKSNLISVIVHSLCHRYSPDELELYLLDFKEGVTLQRFADGPQGEYLPHARVLGLEADREFGLAVLKHLFEVYSSRMKQFKEAGVQSLREYRMALPEAQMPRIVLIVDEFQMMFSERDKLSDQIADLLQKGVRLFRACGIHIILASQTIGGNNSLMGSAAEGLFGQVPIRIALKNSLTESQATLGARNDAAAHLRSREAIVNLDYGAVAANKKTAITFADEAILGPLRRQWWNGGSSAPAPYVFDGESALSLDSDKLTLSNLSNHDSGSAVAFLGHRIDVDGSVLSIPMNHDVGRNMAIIGPANAAIPLANAIRSLSLQHEPETAEVVVIDLLNANKQWEATRTKFYSDLTASGIHCKVVEPEDIEATIDELADRAATSGSLSSLKHSTYLLGLGLERLRSAGRFSELCRTGADNGIHIFGWWLKADAFNDHVGYGGNAYFDIKAAYGLDTQTTRRLLDEPLLEWRPRSNRMIIWDAASMPAPVRLIPYTTYPGVDTPLER